MIDDLYPKCKWCNQDIKQYPAYGIAYDTRLRIPFCDILCAKLYNDNVDKIEFDFDSFTRDYSKTNPKRLRILYERCSDSLFEELPIYTADNRYSKKEIKDQYERLFLRH